MSDNSNKSNTMFQKPFSFEGRIRRTEYALSLIGYFVFAFIMSEVTLDGNAGLGSLFFLLFIGVFWLLLAQGCKRCHDLGHSGWYQIIPFYFVWLVFAKGELGTNKYGLSPKPIAENQTVSESNSTNR